MDFKGNGEVQVKFDLAAEFSRLLFDMDGRKNFRIAKALTRVTFTWNRMEKSLNEKVVDDEGW